MERSQEKVKIVRLKFISFDLTFFFSNNLGYRITNLVSNSKTAGA